MTWQSDFIALGLVMTWEMLDRFLLKLKMSSRSSFEQVADFYVFFQCVGSSIEWERKRNKSKFHNKEKSLCESPDQFRGLPLLGSKDGGWTQDPNGEIQPFLWLSWYGAPLSLCHVIFLSTSHHGNIFILIFFFLFYWKGHLHSVGGELVTVH